MSGIAVSNVRNFAIAGHSGSGKTTLADAILFKLGLNDRAGSVDSQSSMADYTDEEKAKKTTIFAKPFTGSFASDGQTASLVFTDTPGYADFFGQVIAAFRASDSVLIAIDANSGIQVGTHHAWRQCDRNAMPRGIVITGLDRDNSSFDKAFDQVCAKFHSRCVPVVIPAPDGTRLIDVLDAKDVPAALAPKVEAARSALMEAAAETDDSLIEKFLGGEPLTPEELAVGLRKAVLTGALVPVFACATPKGIGLDELLKGIVRLFPSPADTQPKDSSGNALSTADDAPFVGFVWRVVNDPFIGQLTFVRVVGGTFHSDSEVQNGAKDQKERIGTLLVVNGRKQASVSGAIAGQIVAVPKLKTTAVSDTLCDMGKNITCQPITFPSPVMFVSVSGKSQADEDKIGSSLARVAEEDPTMKVVRNTETKEMLLAGLGDVHIDVAVARMKTRNNVELVLNTPKVPYRETVTARGEGHYKHKKQTGGRGQFGEVYLRVAPRQKDDEEWFVDATVGGSIPHNFMPAVQKGVVEGMTKGAVAGYPVTDVKIEVHDGSFHEVDSSEISFKIAGARALKDAMSNAKPVLLEPIMTVKVTIPDQYMGDITGDLNHRRGRILGMGSDEGMQTITADIPQAELFRYAAELRSMTAGQGSFEMEFSRYEIVPSNIAQKIVAATKKEDEEE